MIHTHHEYIPAFGRETGFALLLALVLPLAAQAGFIRTHHEFIPDIGANATWNMPDPTQANESFRIESGQTVVITGNESVKDIYINGMGDAPAVLELSAGCELRVQTILQAGTRAIFRIESPAKIVWRDLPLDLVNDPQQFGNGLLCISGEFTIRGGSVRQSKAEVAAEILAGNTSITLRGPPVNWQAGDEIWIPDTRQPSLTSGARRVEAVRIAQVDGSTVTLAAPVQWDHLGWHRSDGTVGELFEIANVTQSVVFESENPNGVRGHMLFMDHALVDIEGVSFRHMGRTTTAPLHNTTWTGLTGPLPGTVQQIGLNQIGKYAVHFHGCPGRSGLSSEWQHRMVGFSIVGSPKWGLVAHHSTFFSLFENFAVVDCAGGHITIETPNVSANAFRDFILIAKTSGSGQRITDRAHRNLAGGDHWHDAVGLGLQSLMNEFTDGSIYCCKESIGLTGFGTTQLFRPLVRGQHLAINSAGVEKLMGPMANPRSEYPLLYPLTDVRAWGGHRGVEVWTVNAFPDSIWPHGFFDGLELIHCRIPTDFQDQRETTLRGWRILGDFDHVVAPTNLVRPEDYAIDFKDAYRFGITVTGGEIRGYDAAYELIHDQEYTTFENVEVECPCVMYEPMGYLSHRECDISWTDCTFTPVDGNLQGINGWLPKYGLEAWLNSKVPNDSRPSLNHITITFRPWSDGRDLDIYHHEQQPSFELSPVTATEGHGDWPLGVWTHQQLIDLGTPIYGSVTPTTAVTDPEHFGRFWINDVTLKLLRERVEDHEARILELESQN